MTQQDETIAVNKEALYKVLRALNGPHYLILELMATRHIAQLTGQVNPIDQLIKDYESAA